MTEFTGFTIVSGAEYADNNPHLSQELDTLGLWDWPPLPAEAGTSLDNSVCSETNNLLVTQEAQQAFAGDTAPAFSQDWYNTIHVIPNPIALGNLLSSQERDFEVWNAYFVTQNLASVTPANADGLTLQEPQVPPTDFGPLASRIYTLNISTSGPSTIDATYTFDFPSDDPILRVTGVRVIVFPFQPNWKDPFMERIEWGVEVLPHYDGSEQLVKTRQTPRHNYEYTFTAHGLDKQRFNAAMFGWQSKVFALPVWSDASSLTAPASVNDTTIYLDTSDRGFVDGGLLTIFIDTSSYESVEISTVNASDIVLAQPVLNNWPKNAKVLPTRLARVSPNTSTQLLNPNISEGKLKFQVEVNYDYTATDSVTTYRSLPVMDTPPYWHKQIDTQMLRELQVLDNSTGIRTVNDPSDLMFSSQQYHWAKIGKPQITEFREWLFARQGKLVPFWTSTFQPDLTMYDLTGSSITNMRIHAVGYPGFYSTSVNRKDIRVELKDGTVFYRRITASSDIGGGVEELVMDSSFGQDVSPSEVKIISFLYLARLDTNILEVAWRNQEYVEVTAPIKSKKYDV